MIVWIAKAEFDVLALEMRMRELLPVFLMVVMITALVLEVWHPCFTELLLARIRCAYCRAKVVRPFGAWYFIVLAHALCQVNVLLHSLQEVEQADCDI